MSFFGLSWGMGRGGRVRVAAVLGGLSAALGAEPAVAQVMEPNGLLVPQPVGGAEISIATGRGLAAESLMLSGLFSCFHDDMLDPVMDADVQPAAFSPLCGFTGTLVMRGGGCKLDFGWYNANASNQKPTDAEIFTLVPAAMSVPAGGPDQDFCPLAADHVGPDPNRADVIARVAACNSCPDNRAAGLMTFSAEGIRSDPNFRGPAQGGTGLIGFAIRGSSATQCPETHFSENKLNTCVGANCTNPGPWVMALIYTSQAHADSFYIAFEDLPTTNWGQGNPVNDGDFNDFVYFVTGLTCDGGGQPCTVEGRMGACAGGVTACINGGEIVCRGGLEPTTEQCDNIDNDCNGMVDDDPTLCTAENKVCYQGKCVPRCGTGEFQCQVGEDCVSDLCVDRACIGITCGAEEVCRGGSCVGACTGIVCPLTTNGRPECRLGRCADPCVAAGCEASGLVCEKGSCVRSCDCRACPEGTTCNNATGQCTDAACAMMNCPAGQICFEGACQDPCAGAVCPGGAACNAGECGPPGTSGTGGGGNNGGTGGVLAGTGGTIVPQGGSSSASGGGGNSGDGDDGEGDLGTPPKGNPGCACNVVGSRDASGAMTLLAAALAGALGVRRRRQRA